MSCFLWLFLLCMNYFCLFSLKSLVLGLFMFMCSLSVSILMSMYSLSWYALVFFLVYVGGLLVLFIYMSSLKFKPAFYFSKTSSLGSIMLKANVLFFVLIILTQITWNFKYISWSSIDSKKYSFNLFNDVEVLFLINVGLLLLIVLWVMTKLSFQSRSALRPYFLG